MKRKKEEEKEKDLLDMVKKQETHQKSLELAKKLAEKRVPTATITSEQQHQQQQFQEQHQQQKQQRQQQQHLDPALQTQRIIMDIDLSLNEEDLALIGRGKLTSDGRGEAQMEEANTDRELFNSYAKTIECSNAKPGNSKAISTSSRC